MKLSENFTLAEYEKSQTALRHGLDNSVPEALMPNVLDLFENVVQKVRDHFGPTVINSGFRGPELNSKVGGSSKSQHCKGEAVDIEVPGYSNYEVACWIKENLEFDQLILEGYTSNDPNSGWVHCSYKASGNRKESLTADFSTGKAVYEPGLIE